MPERGHVHDGWSALDQVLFPNRWWPRRRGSASLAQPGCLVRDFARMP